MFENDNNSIKKAQEGDKYELERLIRQNSGLIWSIVKRFSGRGFELEDLYQIGCVGFIKSIKRFDTSFEVKLSTYTVPYILGEIKRHIRDNGAIKVSRSIKELQAKINQIQTEYKITHKEEISINEIARKLKVSKEDVAIALEATKPIESIDNTYKSEKGDKGVSLIDKASTGENQEEIITNKIALKEAINKLEDNDKQIILLRFYKEKTQSEVARILGVSQVQVSRTERKILNKMKTALTDVS